jgi:hypothetical protein
VFDPPRDERAALKRLAVHSASTLGHALGIWHDGTWEEEVAYCQSCGRKVIIDLLRDPHMAGSATSEACPRAVLDPFLANTDVRRI